MEEADKKLLPSRQVAVHNNPTDCWIVVDNKVWDVSQFLPEHPGGPGSK